MAPGSMTFEQLVRKILDDSAFRAAVAADPRQALEAAGVDPSDEMVQALEEFDRESANRVAAAFDGLKFIT